MGHLETGPTAPDRPRPTPAPPRARRLASRTRRAHLPPFPSPPSQAAPAPSRAREQTPWSVTRGVVAGVAFGALVIAGGALVAGGPTNTAESAILARLGSSRKPDVSTESTSAAFFSLPSFERDAARLKPAVADLGRAAAEQRREEVSRKRSFGGRSDGWGIEKTRAESSLGKKSLRGEGSKRSLSDDDLESDAELFEATLAFAKPRPEDERERAARSKDARKPNKRVASKQNLREGKADEDDTRLDLAIADELSDLAERDAAEDAAEDGDDAAFEDETLDDLFEPADVSAASARDDGAISLDALAAEAASEMGEARGEDAAPEPEDSAAPEPEDSAAPEPEDSAAPEPEDPNVEREPNIVPGMTYEEEQAEYARFAEAEAARNEAIAAEAEGARNEAIAAEAARANAEADSAAAAAEGAVPADAAKEAFEAEEAQRRAEFEAAEAQRRAEFEAAAAQGGEAELGEELDSFSFAAEAPAESPEPSDGFFSESFSEPDSSSEGFFAETFAEAPAFSSPFFESDAADAPAAEPANQENPDLPFPYSFEAATPTVTPSDKDLILRSAADALGPMLRETAAQALEEYAKRLREEADTEDGSFTFPDASFASGEEVANAIENSFEEVVPPSYGAEELANATSAEEPATETSEAESETPETTETETIEEVPEEVPEPESPDAEASAPEPAEPAEAFAEDEAGSFEEAFAFAPAESEASDEVAFAPAPSESEAFEADAFAPEPSEPEDDALAFLLAEGADAAVSASLSLPDDASDPEVPTESSEAADAASNDIDAIYDAVDDVSAVTQRLEAALGAASAAHREAALGAASHHKHHGETKLAVGADGVIVRETKSAKAKKDSSSSKSHSVNKQSSKTSSRLTKAERARGWSDGDETVLRSLSRTSDARASKTAGSLNPRHVKKLSGSIPGGDAEPAWATIGSKKQTTKKASSSKGKHESSGNTLLERSLAVSAEEAAAAAAAADEEALRVDTTLDAVQQAIADQRRDDAPAATLYLAPLSVVGVAGVVVIAILLVRHRDPRGTRRDGDGRGAGSIPGDGETTSLLGGSERGDVETGSFPADALLKTSNENLRALFGSVGDFGKERVFATPSETDAESAAEGGGSRKTRLAYGAKESSNSTNHGGVHHENGVAANLFNRARASLEAAERFSSSRVSALRASVERTARMVTASARGEESGAAAAAVPSERGGGATPATEVSSPTGSPRGEPAATVLDVAADISRAHARAARKESAFSAAEMRRAEERARRQNGVATGPGSKSPPSSFVDPVSAPGSPEPVRRNVNGTAAARPALLVSEEARRRFQHAAATSAHARAFAAPPRPHLATSSAGGGERSPYERLGSTKNAVMGAGRAVAPETEGPPAMVKSTTRFL